MLQGGTLFKDPLFPHKKNKGGSICRSQWSKVHSGPGWSATSILTRGGGGALNPTECCCRVHRRTDPPQQRLSLD